MRFVTSGPASLEIRSPHSRWPGRMIDVSFGGLLVELEERPDLPVGAEVQVRFGGVSTTGELRHVTEHDSRFRVGIRVEHVEITTTSPHSKQ